MSEENGLYRPINLENISKGSNLTFDVYYESKSVGGTFVKFASADNPRHQEKVKEFLGNPDFNIQLYIEEKDLFKYYDQATISLKKMMSSDVVPLKEKTKKVYSVSKEIMKDFFEFSATDKVLGSSEKVMEIMEDCISDNNVGFKAISQITNKDYYTYTHSVNVGLYCMTFGVKLKMGRDDVRELGLGGMLHDVGKAEIPHELINKNGALTDEEFKIIQNHSPKGEEYLSNLNCYSQKITCMAGQHHEKWKGGGYPKNLMGDQIAVNARICKIMDVYDALSTRRSYKKAMNSFEALTLMKQKMNDHFDPKLLNAFIRLMGPDM